MKSADVPPLQITRIFDAPRSEVFEWWAEAEKLQQWSGCKQCIESEVEMDFRVGGGFRQKMKISANGRVCDFLLKGAYEEIVAPERICYLLDMGQQVTRVRIQFFEEGARTRMVLTQDGFATPESSKIVSQGTNESLDELNLLLTRSTARAREAVTELA